MVKLIERRCAGMSNHDMEKMLSQLIRMVGTLQASQEEMIQSQQKMEARLDKMEARLDGMESIGEERHQEIVSHLEKLERDQDFIGRKQLAMKET